MAEAHAQVKNGHVLKFVKDYWFLLIALVGLSIGWAEVRAGIEFNKLTNEDQEISINATAEALRILDLRYTEDVSIIKTKLEQLVN